MKEISKRIITGFILLFLLILGFYYSYILIILLFLLSIIAWVEFYGLINKIYKENNLLKLFFNTSSLLYIFLFSTLIFYEMTQIGLNYKFNVIYLFIICICSDIGGFIFGKIFKGKKLTKISPNKTISGSLGSFILSIIIIPVFYKISPNISQNIYELIIITIFVSFSCQLGDLFFSYIKRKAKVKDTGNILPGHGGILDRIDGMLLAIPAGIMLWKFILIV